MRKFHQKLNRVDIMREQQLKGLRQEIEQVNQALNNNDLFKAQYHAMNARFYRNLLGL